jgi:hypothetical protein
VMMLVEVRLGLPKTRRKRTIHGYGKSVWERSRIAVYVKGTPSIFLKPPPSPPPLSGLPLTRQGNNRFAFVDFTSIEYATAALIHPKNHQLDGRKLVVEYASADAVRRGGGGGAGPRPKNVKASGGEGHSHRKKKLGSTVDDRADERDLTTMAITMTIKKSKPQEEEKGRRGGTFAKAKVTSGTSRKSRPTPGAALALAKREQVAIVPSQGRRITFDD